jgi:hypothetical protein
LLQFYHLQKRYEIRGEEERRRKERELIRRSKEMNGETWSIDKEMTKTGPGDGTLTTNLPKEPIHDFSFEGRI